MNMNLLFGISAFDRARDVCEILESVAPNVSELQLFRDDDAGLCTGRECLFILSHRFKSSHLGGSVLVPPTFTFSPFVAYLSLFAPGPLDSAVLGLGCVPAVLQVTINDPTEVIFFRPTWISAFGSR